MLPSYKNILIIRTDRIGDVILTTPAVHALREAFPQARITILVSSGNEVLVEDNPDIDAVLVDARKAGNKRPTGFWQLVATLKKGSFDCALIYHTKRRTNLAVFLAGIPVRIGYKNDKFGFLLNHPLKDERHLGLKHEAAYCVDLLKPLDVTTEEFKLFLPVPQISEAWFQDMCRKNAIAGERPLVLIHPGASDPAKCWPSERFTELINRIHDKKECQFILIGTSAIAEEGAKIAHNTRAPLVNLIGQTNLSQLMSLVYHSQLMVSNDSGPVHIAAAYGKPVVSIFTRNHPGINPQRWQPLGKASQVVSVPEEKSIINPKAGPAAAEYLQLIDTEAVIQSVDAVFKLC